MKISNDKLPNILPSVDNEEEHNEIRLYDYIKDNLSDRNNTTAIGLCRLPAGKENHWYHSNRNERNDDFRDYDKLHIKFNNYLVDI